MTGWLPISVIAALFGVYCFAVFSGNGVVRESVLPVLAFSLGAILARRS